MATERDAFGVADVIIVESDDERTMYAACTRCTHTIAMPAETLRTFADQIIDHQWAAHHRAFLAIRFAGVDATFSA